MALSTVIKYRPDDQSNNTLHERIVKAVCDRAKASKKQMDKFNKQWSSADDSMRAYIHEKELDRSRRQNKEQLGTVDYVTLEVPYTFATVMTAHTYYSSVILSRNPLWQFTARHGQGQDAVQAVEAVMDYQQMAGQHKPPLYHFLYDLAKYSLGIGGVFWEEEERMVSSIKEVPRTFLGVEVGGTKKQRVEEIVKGFQGNKLYNIRPYDFLPDPRLALWKFQEGEFAGRCTSETFANLIACEHANPGTYINLEFLRGIAQETRGQQTEDASSRVIGPLKPGEEHVPGMGSFNLKEMYVKLIPKMWGLAKSGRLEIWKFLVAEDKLLIQAAPMGLYHNMFPYFLAEGNFGSEEFAKFGMIEIMRPLTDVLTWLVNSHFYNVRRVLNNQLVFDPSRVTMKDLTKAGQRLIRLKPQAYGTDVRLAIHQLQQTDVTRTHLNDAQYIEEMIHKVTAVMENVMGLQNTGGRRSATEARQSFQQSITRLKTPVEYNSELAFAPLARQMLSNTQQMMDIERKYAIAGNTIMMANKFVDVTPELIAGEYDFVPVDGAMPVDRLAQATFWKELIGMLMKSPTAPMEWDLNAMLAYTMQMQGERNVDRFQIKIGSPEFLERQAQLGNLIQVGGGPNGGGGPGNRGAGRGSAGGTGAARGAVAAS